MNTKYPGALGDLTQALERVETVKETIGGGEVVMLNLLRFRNIADYSATPELAPDQPISRATAYELYMDHVKSVLMEGRGEDVLFSGNGGYPLIGIEGERWDHIRLIRQPGLDSVPASLSNPLYLAGVGHRTAAIEDSRLYPFIDETVE